MENKSVTECINRIQLTNSGIENADFDILWVSATDKNNSDALTTHFHHHTFFELHIISGGYVIYGFEDRDVKISSGNMLIVPSNIRHTVRGYSDSFSKLTVAFESLKNEDFCEAVAHFGNLPIKLDAALNEILMHFIEISLSKSDFKNELALLSLIQFVYGLCSLCGIKFNRQIHLTEDYDSRLIKAKKYINDNTDIFFTCEDVANHCHISSKQLGRLFRESEGVSLLDYIHKGKLESVLELLLTTAMPLGEISKRLGFSSVQYLCKFVKSKTGKTPKELRRNKTCK